jgi:transcriptional regulator with XRE-family HTH domain|nr:MAG TPA: Helix-turn-helix XRE-family like protein [Bacteriophage sp.]
MRTIDPFSKKVQFKGRIFLAKNFQGGETVNFSEKARAMRMKSPLTLREIGEQCNASESMVSRYISGAVKPPDDVAEKILEVLRNSEQDDDRGIYASHIDDLRRLIRQQQREKWVLFGILTFLLIFLLLLYLDATHGAWGVIQYVE